MKVLRTTDIITLKQNEIEVDFTPLRYDRALELSKCVTVEAGKTVSDEGKQTALMLKYSVKEIRGLKDWNDEEIVIKAVNGELSEEDVSTAISSLVQTPFLGPIAMITTSAIPRKVDGVELLINGKAIDLGKK